MEENEKGKRQRSAEEERKKEGENKIVWQHFKYIKVVKEFDSIWNWANFLY